ncbi:DUF192 domain-containing protein [Natronomonas sp. EA1]|uniref:DUF192 domain-containing protein n=1 Tax=Natronomonas sp. EA1 TaxID=3421655 RepID=UPI003EB956E3
MRLIRNPEGGREVIATDIEFADSLVTQGRGLMFRRSIPDDYALVFRFGELGTVGSLLAGGSGVRNRGLHMLFVPFDIDAVWLVDGEVREVQRLRAWRGHGSARADTVVELPAGAADSVEVGDQLVLG